MHALNIAAMKTSALILFLAAFVGQTMAHGVPTHQNITRLAVEYVRAKVSELSCMTDTQLQIGTAKADETPLFMFHFNPRLNGDVNVSPLVPNRSVSATCTSIEWGLQKSPSCTETGGTWYNNITETFVNQHTWPVALDHARDGFGRPSDKGWEDLGYVLHLLHDLTSPAHTRNDPHPGGSETDPIEAVTRTPSLPTSPLITFDTPEQFFAALQNWTSSNFYSRDTVFGSPGPAVARVEGAYFLDASGQKIAHRGARYLSSGADDSHRDKTLATIDSVVADAQWERLGPQAVLYAASFIKLYYDRVRPLTCNAISVKEITCSNGRRNDNPAIPAFNWKISGTASSTSALTILDAFPNVTWPANGVGTRVSTCDAWTGTATYLSYYLYCARLAQDPGSTNWTATTQSPVQSTPFIVSSTMRRIESLEFSSSNTLTAGPKRIVTCPGTYKFE